MQVVQCRKLLYEMANASMDKEPPIKPEGWKKACASVLALTVSDYIILVLIILSGCISCF